MAQVTRSEKEFLQQVYAALQKIQQPQTLLAKNTYVRGMSGKNHEFPLYAEMAVGELRLPVAFHCREDQQPLSGRDLADFAGQVADVPGLAGVVVARNGYEDDMATFAQQFNLMLVDQSDLAQLQAVLSYMLQQKAIPADQLAGQPFWALMEVQEERLNGNYVWIPGPGEGTRCIPLFFSRLSAQRFGAGFGTDQVAVRGIAQSQLRILLDFVAKSEGLSIAFPQPPADGAEQWACVPVKVEDLRTEYLISAE